MTDPRNPNQDERVIESIIDHMLGETDGVSTNAADDSLAREMEDAAALLDLEAARMNPIEIPDGLSDRLLASVDSFAAQENTAEVAATSLQDQEDGSRSYPFPQDVATDAGAVRWVPWAVAAAAILVASVSLLMPQGAESTIDLQSQRIALIDQTPETELLQWDWISTDDAAVQGDVIGDVVWSNTLNKGYMRISGLAINDPSLEQYQLWIFDATRPSGDLPQFGEGLLSQRPVDGGVFDINSDGEVIIEIDAKLAIQQAAAFAITVEPPGGVVVSDRSRVPLLALAP